MPASWMRDTALLIALPAAIFLAMPGIASAQQPTQAQAGAIRQSCRADYEAHCASVSPGGSAALQCLQQNLASLSPSCQTAVSAVGGGSAAPTASAPPASPPQAGGMAPPPPMMSFRQQAAMMRGACGGDFRAFCSGIRLGGGRALACLADHRESLSPPCRDAMAAARGQ